MVKELLLHFDPEKAYKNATGYDYIMNQLRMSWQEHMMSNKSSGSYVVKLSFVEEK